MKKNKEGNKRKHVREQIIGDILWAYASDPDTHNFDGAMIDESEVGIRILTSMPVQEGNLLRVYCKGHWEGARYATVKWCQKVDEDTYTAGLLILMQ